MTKLLYLDDSYLKEFEGNVQEARGDCVILDKTVFYPRGGGQPGDEGRLFCGGEEFDVTETFKDQGVVLHRLSKGTPAAGSTVKGVLNWDLRYAYMKHHSAIHVLCGVLYRLSGALTTGGQIYRDRARIDFDVDVLAPDTVTTVQEKANEVVGEGRRITAKLLPKEEALQIPDLIRTKPGLALVQSLPEIRVVEIQGYDIQADGGTHVSNTKEIGGIKIVKTESKGKHNKRIEFVLE